MKCRYVVDNDADLASMTPEELERVKAGELLKFRKRANGLPSVPYWPANFERETPHAPLLVQLGICEPADDECAKAVGWTEEQLKLAQVRYRRVQLGIHPEDFELYDMGVMVGYNADGSMKPGPRYDEYMAAKKAEEDAEEKDVI